LIPPPRRHRHHYHGAFAPNSPFKPFIAAIETPAKIVAIKEIAEKTSKVSLNWAKLIARIYETHPLLCSCGKEIKISRIVTNTTEIWRLLTKIGWPATAPEFDEPLDLVEWEICQLAPGTDNGFPDDRDQSYTSGKDPPEYYFSEIDPPHWEESNFIQYD
jgi:hypothetical protein